MKGKSYASLQKTYDQAHLTCTTAVYYESLGNETEALRCWRECLQQLQGCNSTAHSYSRSRTASERSLLLSLNGLREQCEDRIALLQAILISRLEAENSGAGSVVHNQSLSAPLSPPILPQRPITAAAAMTRPGMPERGGSSYSGTGSVGQSSFTSTTPPPHSFTPTSDRGENRRTLLTTLRPPAPNRKTTRTSQFPDGLGAGGPVAAARAATMAWSTPRAESSNTVHTLSPDSPTRHAASSSTGDLPSGRRLSIDSGEGSPTLTVRRRPGTGTLKSRPQSSALPLGSPTQPVFDDYPPPPPPPHRIPVQRAATAIPRKPVGSPPSHTHFSPYAPPPLPPKPLGPQHRPADLTKLNTHTLERNRYRSISNPDFHSQASSSSHSLPYPQSPSSRPSSPHRRSPSPPSPESRSSTPHTPASTSPTSPAAVSSDSSTPTPFQIRLNAALESIKGHTDSQAASQVASDIVISGDHVTWDDVAGLTTAKQALKEAVVYPFLRPDLFSGLREPARGILLFGPPGTGKTMLARAVATESRSTFFSISASSLTSKYLGESEKLVKALFCLAKAMAPSIIFVDEIDSLLSSRSDSGSESEATRRIKTEFLIQWSDLARAAAGRERGEGEGDLSRVLVLAATNLPWAIDEAARRRFVRRVYIPLPEEETRKLQFEKLLQAQKHQLGEEEMKKLVEMTDGFSGSDITALAKDAAMGPLRSLGEKLLETKKEEIRGIEMEDFRKSLETIRPSVSKEGLGRFEEWARMYGERAS
ncbi:AAA-domain-containing protein [Ascodesmis nigricans]|uniref:AAA-domain-containing protein n=1 Tax=Ascodesmis nigricans TaxID=341454 RepID=A0A4S2MX72_9PEZI|nr:AAA-domain-containing protein [Ascodesmis nigricans]